MARRNHPKHSRKPKAERYDISYKHYPQHPEVERFVSQSRKTIIINLSAHSDAKIIKLLP